MLSLKFHQASSYRFLISHLHPSLQNANNARYCHRFVTFLEDVLLIGGKCEDSVFLARFHLLYLRGELHFFFFFGGKRKLRLLIYKPSQNACHATHI